MNVLSKKRFARAVTIFSAALVATVAIISVLARTEHNDAYAISGTWANYVNTDWYNPGDARYKGYTATPGSSEAQPFLIKTAEEFSGIRAFEGGVRLLEST